MKITSALYEAMKAMKEKNIPAPRHITKNDFTTITFILEEPDNGKIVKEYKFNASEFKKLPYNKQRKYNNLPRTCYFDESQYNKALKDNKKRVEEYNNLLNETYKKILVNRGISKEQEDKFSDMMRVISDYVDFEDLEESDIFDLEDEILQILK